jgi:hypothetical protein
MVEIQALAWDMQKSVAALNLLKDPNSTSHDCYSTEIQL